MEFLEGFERRDGRVVGRILTSKGVEFIDDLGQLRLRGLPRQRPFKANLNQILELNDLELVDTNEYIEGVGLSSLAGKAQHDVFVHHTLRLKFLIPALALARGLFPLIPAAFESLFSPRGLTEMCTPFERNGHWTAKVAMTHYRPKGGGVPLPMQESLTWANLYRSGEQAWNSVYSNASEGRMRVALPAARVNILMHGVRSGYTVYVTSLKVAALLTYGDPFEFARGAPRSFLLHQNAESLHGPANNYYVERSSAHTIDPSYLLTDREWQSIKHIFEKESERGGDQKIPRRALADAFIKRMVTGVSWADVLYAPLAPRAGGKQWRTHRVNGKLQEFIEAMQCLRPDAGYLSMSSRKNSSAT